MKNNGDVPLLFPLEDPFEEITVPFSILVPDEFENEISINSSFFSLTFMPTESGTFFVNIPLVTTGPTFDGHAKTWGCSRLLIIALAELINIIPEYD